MIACREKAHNRYPDFALMRGEREMLDSALLLGNHTRSVCACGCWCGNIILVENPSLSDETADWIGSDQIQGARDEQEDASVFRIMDLPAGAAIAVIADGMGGHRGGDIASQAAAQAFLSAFDADQDEIGVALNDALEQAGRAIARQIETNPYLRGMGTTLVAAHVADGKLHWISVGDSVLWLFRNGTGRRLNHDHSISGVTERLRAAGRGDEADALADVSGSMLLSALTGLQAPDEVDIPDGPIRLIPDDKIVIASDGILTMDAAEIAGILADHAGNAGFAARAVLDAVEAAGAPNQDNASLIVIEFRG